jgi:small subunit ribosomal protein S16
VGFYNPIAAGGEERLRIAHDRLNYWVGVGAQTSSTVDRLIKQAGKPA